MSDRDEKGRFLPCHDIAGPGRRSAHQEWMNDVAHRLAILGLTKEAIAEALGISQDTFYRWQKEIPAFSEAVQSGGIRADADVAFSLYNRAIGMVVTSERAFKNSDGEVVVAQTKTQLPPDTKACQIFLSNRDPERWRKEKLPPEDDAPLPLKDLTDDEINAKIAELEARRKQGG